MDKAVQELSMTKDQIPSRLPIPFPFAIYGETDVRNSEIDPLSALSSSKYFDASYQWNGTTPPSKFITRQLMNKLFAQISGRQFLNQCGYIDTFDQKVCDAIGGYPRGAVLKYLIGDILYDVVSLVDSNTIDYTKVGIDNVNWKIYGSSVFTYIYPDYGTTGSKNILKSWTTPNPDTPPNSVGSAVGILAEPLTITSPCWIQAFIDNPKASAGQKNYQSGIILYGRGAGDPQSLPENDNTEYTVCELTEGGTVTVPVLPVLPGDKIAAFVTALTNTSYHIVIRKLTPARTR